METISVNNAEVGCNIPAGRRENQVEDRWKIEHGIFFSFFLREGIHPRWNPKKENKIVATRRFAVLKESMDGEGAQDTVWRDQRKGLRLESDGASV